MIAKLEWTQSIAQQNIEQVQNQTMGVTISNESTTTEPPPNKFKRNVRKLYFSDQFKNIIKRY